MDILSEYRITALQAPEHELAQHAERVRVALERAPQRRTLRDVLGLRRRFTSTITGPITAPITLPTH
jgi:hypothetical protein